MHAECMFLTWQREYEAICKAALWPINNEQQHNTRQSCHRSYLSVLPQEYLSYCLQSYLVSTIHFS